MLQPLGASGGNLAQRLTALATGGSSPQVPGLLGADSIGNAAAGSPADAAVREAFSDFVGQTFYGQMLKSLRQTVDQPAYFHGGRAEEVFQQQLDQVLAEQLSDATADQFANPMYELFALNRR